ncbi:hemerythrin domain-containing protein [Rhodoferax sp.]|uniref:hemerythrin domain-containing protein n=1 Tax=Rhodoferax sp. TaxID=50421 RepID=UPI00283FD840|nr:hemerythrin domain-containing protein [Rhodoferax sp.]MDR3370242.1 hemerythrin domain-containing protein [Rhodoferax sp.]
MVKASIQIIHDEHTTLASMLRSIGMMVERGPGKKPQDYFDVMRAMLFYIDEFPERLHHPKETELLFPPVARLAPETREVIERLDNDHIKGEAAVRELQHLLLAWELLGDTRREAFDTAIKRYLGFYLEHMRLEETVVIPAALKVLGDADWLEIDAAFAANCDPLTGKYPRDPIYDRLFTRIVNHAPAPIGLGES